MSVGKPLHIVTGGAGFIGSNVVAALEEQGAEVIVVDSPGADQKWRNLAKRHPAALLPAGDRLDSIKTEIASVIHMGAITSTTERDTDLIMENNYHYPCQLWDWCISRGVPFVYASSAATYGDGAAGFEDRDDAAYLASLSPLNPYGRSKHLFDRWACDRARSGEAPPHWAGLKFFNVYGPNEFHKAGQRSTILQMFEQIKDGGPVRLFASDNPAYPDGGQMRDFVWVGDCVAIALWFADAPRPSGLYNVGTGKARSFADMAHAVYAALGRKPEIHYIPMPDALKGQYQYFTEGPMTKLAAAGYPDPPTMLEEGVTRYVQDFLSRDDPYR